MRQCPANTGQCHLSHGPQNQTFAPTVRGRIDQALETRADLRLLAESLLRPIEERRSAGGARVLLGPASAHYSTTVAEFEGFARPLWAIASLVAGGADGKAWGAAVAGLDNGTNPDHPEFWGTPGDRDQRLVEMAPIAFALASAPDYFWHVLPTASQTRVSTYLRAINGTRVTDSNWLFFRVLVNLALWRLDAGPDLTCLTKDLVRLESFYLGDGWYSDGHTQQRDYYVAFAMHFYSLVYCALGCERDRLRCSRFADRARQFASAFMHWFAADGSSVPYGRSLVYRFAHSSFWGALAFAGIEALPWGAIKGLLLRNIRWWIRQPIFDEAGLLSLGYRYPNLMIPEGYSSPASPYWALKAFLPLALPDSHPFWTSAEAPLPDMPVLTRQAHPRFLLYRDSPRDHIVAFAGGQWADWTPRHVAEKYSKFCYSNRFGFSVPGAASGLEAGAHDNSLALSDDGRYFRGRERATEIIVTDCAVRCDWSPWAGVSVRTWLIPVDEWHVRVHRIATNRRLLSVEGGFALGYGTDYSALPVHRAANGCGLIVATDRGLSGISALLGSPQARAVAAAPNTNILYPRTIIPSLLQSLPTGNHLLACAVLGSPESSDCTAAMVRRPMLLRTRHRFLLFNASGQLLYSAAIEST